MLKSSFVFLFSILILAFQPAVAQQNGNLQIHYMDVGQGDGAILISPLGQTVMFDSGDSKECEKPLAYLESLGVRERDRSSYRQPLSRRSHRLRGRGAIAVSTKRASL